MKYLMLLYADTPMPEPGTPEARKLFDEWTEASQAMAGAAERPVRRAVPRQLGRPA